MKTTILYYSLVRRIDDLKYYFTRLIEKQIPVDAMEKIVAASELLAEAKSITINFYNDEK